MWIFFCTFAPFFAETMQLDIAAYRIWTWLRHLFTSWNTTGEGIHSPYLFEIVRFVFRDENSFYCFADIERQRERLCACSDELNVLDFGSQGSPEGTLIRRRVDDIAKTHLESPKMAQLLFRLVNFMTQKEKRPLQIVELGTSLGITTAYLALPDSRNRVLTLEGSEQVLRVAQDVWRALHIDNIDCRQGNIDLLLQEDTLFTRARKENGFLQPDFVFIDANHTFDATLRYARFFLPQMTEKGVIVMDDIHYSPEMERAWHELQADQRVTSSMDLYHAGILFVDKHYLKRHYRIRI